MILCVLSAVLLLPAIIWFSLHLGVKQVALTPLGIVGVLCYVAFFGWLLPLSVTVVYCLFAPLRPLTAAFSSPDHRQSMDPNSKRILQPPRYQPGQRFRWPSTRIRPGVGLSTAVGIFKASASLFKRIVATLGRDENCDIWLDDDMASRHHAELAWDHEHVCLTDCDSLNGVLLNGQRIHGTVLLNTDDQFEIGAQRFAFMLAERREVLTEGYDPLANHTWRSSLDLQSNVLPATRPLIDYNATIAQQPTETIGQQQVEVAQQGQSTPSLPARMGIVFIRNGELVSQRFTLERSVSSVGRDTACDLSINDASISRLHAQFLRQADGDYVQDLTGRNGITVNGEPLHTYQLLKQGDSICIGNIHLEYIVVYAEQMTPPVKNVTPLPPVFSKSLSGPVPLRLPSRPKGQ